MLEFTLISEIVITYVHAGVITLLATWIFMLKYLPFFHIVFISNILTVFNETCLYVNVYVLGLLVCLIQI
jgi:hypothetical protein